MAYAHLTKNIIDAMSHMLEPEERVVATWFCALDVHDAVSNQDFSDENLARDIWATDNATDLFLSFVETRAFDKEFGFFIEGVRNALANFIETEYTRNQLKENN